MQAYGLLSSPNVPYLHASALHSTDYNFKLLTVNFFSGSAPAEPSTTNPFDSIILNYLMNKWKGSSIILLAITGTWKGTNKIYDELGWESLTDRRWSRRLFHFLCYLAGWSI